MNEIGNKLMEFRLALENSWWVNDIVQKKYKDLIKKIRTVEIGDINILVITYTNYMIHFLESIQIFIFLLNR